MIQSTEVVGLTALTQGKHFFVKPRTGSDGADGLSPRTALKTLVKALSKCTANQNDTVYLLAEGNSVANTTDYQSVVLDWNKDLVHLIGVNSGTMLGQRSRISNSLTATAIVNGLFIVSANGCRIQDILVVQEGAGTNPTGASIAVVVSGQRNHFVNCQISGIGHAQLDDATSRSLKVSGSENMFSHCYIGLDTIIRGTAAAEVQVGDVARTVFEDCFFNTYTSAAGFYIVTYSAPDRFILFKNCIFNAVQNITSAVSPTAAFPAATSVNGHIIVQGCSFYGFGDVTAADDAKVLISSYAVTGVNGALAGGVDIAT